MLTMLSTTTHTGIMNINAAMLTHAALRIFAETYIRNAMPVNKAVRPDSTMCAKTLYILAMRCARVMQSRAPMHSPLVL